LKVVYSPRYQIDIGPHVFPTLKYRLVHDRLVVPPPARSEAGHLRGSGAGLVRPSDIVEPEPASWDELALVHTGEYLGKMRDGTLSPQEVAELELPWSREMVDGFRLMVGGTLKAAKIACGLEEFGGVPHSAILHQASRMACHIGGGLHHAFPNHGEGFCPFNDVAVAVRVLQALGIERIGIVDLDVHHGNGTAFVFESDARVFTFSMHQQQNYPMWKPRGSLDVGLPDGVRDATFLGELERALPKVMASDPQCVFYLAGADPYEDDQLGGLRLTREGLRRRDQMVIESVKAAGVPLVVTLAGGYARRVEDTVAIHVATIEEVARVA
jgi:acetoin utilization deacetylase AcuC-like enzyme